MKNKEFKQMVKDHVIKQQFIIMIGQNRLHRYYRTVERPYKYYISEWRIMNGKLVRDNFETTESTFNTAHNGFLKQVKCIQGDPEPTKQEINDCRIKQSGYPGEDVPMEQRKYWKLRAGALEFMLKYNEQDKTGTAHS